MKKMFVMVSPPRAGKSTVVKATKRPSEVIISADQIRLLVYGQRFFSGGEDYVWAVRKTMLQALMEQGTDIVIDETNTTKARREPLIKLAKKYGYEAKAVVVKTPKFICIQRAVATNQPDLIPIIETMFEQYEEPSEEEGFDTIEVIPGGSSED